MSQESETNSDEGEHEIETEQVSILELFRTVTHPERPHVTDRGWDGGAERPVRDRGEDRVGSKLEVEDVVDDEREGDDQGLRNLHPSSTK